MSIPEFEVGDLAIPRVAMEDAATQMRLHPVMITEKHVVTCHGGTQVYYVISQGGRSEKAAAIELAAWDSPEVVAVREHLAKQPSWRDVFKPKEKADE